MARLPRSPIRAIDAVPRCVTAHLPRGPILVTDMELPHAARPATRVLRETHTARPHAANEAARPLRASVRAENRFSLRNP